jgi:hypothetical protein
MSEHLPLIFDSKDTAEDISFGLLSMSDNYRLLLSNGFIYGC